MIPGIVIPFAAVAPVATFDALAAFTPVAAVAPMAEIAPLTAFVLVAAVTPIFVVVGITTLAILAPFEGFGNLTAWGVRLFKVTTLFMFEVAAKFADTEVAKA
ncbi:hypothetical protein BC830DRAFT_1120875 [Chytriomyces sp. MP71]|nr:hypothetical protein BC830DRAFT_1120875 [Chytriomyces sp. MP71]